jgi:hypothetical protein
VGCIVGTVQLSACGGERSTASSRSNPVAGTLRAREGIIDKYDALLGHDRKRRRRVYDVL